jgi:hypothetical protein
MIGEEIGTTNQPVHLQELYALGVLMTPNVELTDIYPEGNRMVAVLRNTMTGSEEERLVDRVVVEHGTLPVSELFEQLRGHSVNDGQLDNAALVAGRSQPWAEQAGLKLYRVGDAVSGRNIHAALYDSLRLCKDL